MCWAIFRDEHRQGVLLWHTDGMAAYPNSSLVFGGDDTFFICPKMKRALSKLIKSDFFGGEDLGDCDRI